MRMVTVGIDLAKNIFAVHGVDENGKPVAIKPKLARDQPLPPIMQTTPRLIGLAACSGARPWARLFHEYCHTVRRITPKFVTPLRGRPPTGPMGVITISIKVSTRGLCSRT